MRQLYEVLPRHELRDGSGRFWPERAIGRDPAINVAEVEAALSRRRRPKCCPPTTPPPPSRRPRAPWHKQRVVVPKVLIHDGRRFTYAEAGAKCGISGVAMFKRVRRVGWPAAMTGTNAN
jgi:hypothetical protein